MAVLVAAGLFAGCFGAPPTGDDANETPTNETGLNVRWATNEGVAFTTRVAPAVVGTQKDGNDTWTVIQLGDQPPEGAPGFPAIPVERFIISVPTGATPVIAKAEPAVGSTIQGLLQPVLSWSLDAPEPNATASGAGVRQGPNALRLHMDAAAYEAGRVHPPNPCWIEPLAPVRGHSLAIVACATAQFTAGSNLIKMFDRFSLEVVFEGGSGNDAANVDPNPFEAPAKVSIGFAIGQHPPMPSINPNVDPGCVGEEFLIIHAPGFEHAANKLASWRNAQGLITRVQPTLDAEHLAEDPIWKRLTDCVIPLRYLLLLGDADSVPTVYVDAIKPEFPCGNYLSYIDGTYYAKPYGSGWTNPTKEEACIMEGPPNRIPADTEHVVNRPPCYETGDFCGPNYAPVPIPQIAVGRMPARTADQALDMVERTIEFEKASFDGLRAKTVTLSAGVETNYLVDIWYAERMAALLESQGTDVERLYGNEFQKPIPPTYPDGSPVPSEMQSGDLFLGGKSQAAHENAFQSDRFVVSHLEADYGKFWPFFYWSVHKEQPPSFSWGNPPFDPASPVEFGNAPKKHLPIVLSQATLTGRFDFETNPECKSGFYDVDCPGVTHDSFAEALLREPARAVAVIAPSRGMEAHADRQFFVGLFDAFYPSVLPAFGSQDGAPRLGDAMLHAQAYVRTKAPWYIDQMMIWNYVILGDPALALHNFPVDPKTFSAPDLKAETLPGKLVLHNGVPGSTVTVYQEATSGVIPLGRARVTGSSVIVPYLFPAVNDLPIKVAITGGFAAVPLVIEQSPGAATPTPRVSSSLPAATMTPGGTGAAETTQPTTTPVTTPPASTSQPTWNIEIVRVRHTIGQDAPVEDETVVLTNTGPETTNMTGWYVTDLEGNRFDFPLFSFLPGEQVTIHTGAGENSSSDLYWGLLEQVWDDGSDRASLYSSGGSIVDVYEW